MSVTEAAPLAVAIPVLVACLLLALGEHVPRTFLDVGAVLGTVAVCVVDGLLVHATSSGRVVSWLGGWQPRNGVSVGISQVIDPFGAGIALLAGLLVLAAVVYGWHYFDELPGHFHVLLLLFLAGATGFALTGDLFNLFVFFELMGATAYALTGLKVEEPESVQGGLNFAVINSLGAYFSLAGVALIYARTGALGLAPIGAALSTGRHDPLVVAAFALVLTGLLVKAAVVPVHFWLADAHAVAPTPVCVLFSGVMVELGLYGAARIYFAAFATGVPAPDVQRTLLVLGVLTTVLGAVMCAAQRHLKRLLAYSTVSHAGLFLLALSTLSPDGVAGAALYIAGHAGVKSALFLLAGVLLNRFGSVDEVELHGQAKGRWLGAVLFAIGGLALAGLPPFGTALGKAVSEEATGVAHPWTLVLFIAGSAVTGAAVLRAVLRIFFGAGPDVATELRQAETTRGEEQRESPTGLTRPAMTMLVPIIVLLAGGLAVGCLPSLNHWAGAAAVRFVDSTGYRDQTLHGSAAGPLGELPHTGWTASGVGFGMLSAGLALVLALLAVFASRLPSGVRRVSSTVRGPLRVLRQVHSGHLGDYVTWLLVGMAAWGLLLGLPS